MTKRMQENPLSHMVEEIVDATMAGQAAALQMLQAEMQALTSVMPGAVHPHSAEELADIDRQVEQDFDNMPV